MSENKTTPEERVDAALDSVLRASGSVIAKQKNPAKLAAMREAMRNALIDAYVDGSNDMAKAWIDAHAQVRVDGWRKT